LHRLRFLAEQEIDELLGTLGIGTAFDNGGAADFGPCLRRENHFDRLFGHESVDRIVLPSHAADHLAARNERNGRRTSGRILRDLPVITLQPIESLFLAAIAENLNRQENISSPTAHRGPARESL